MSNQKIKLSEKLKVCLKYLRDPKYQTGVLICCDVCHSTNIRIDKSKTKQHTTDSTYTCLHCGAAGTAHQSWQ